MPLISAGTALTNPLEGKNFELFFTRTAGDSSIFIVDIWSENFFCRRDVRASTELKSWFPYPRVWRHNH